MNIGLDPEIEEVGYKYDCEDHWNVVEQRMVKGYRWDGRARWRRCHWLGIGFVIFLEVSVVVNGVGLDLRTWRSVRRCEFGGTG